MKKLILSTALFISGLALVNAQSDSKDVQLGIKGGLNSSTISGDDFGDLDSRTSFNAGLVAEIPLTERLSFQPEVLYSGQGFDVREIDQDNIVDTDENIEYQLDYIQVPLLLKAYIVKGLSVEAGPQFGFKIHEEFDYQPNSDGGDIEIDSDDSYVKDFDTSIALGAAYKFDNGFFLSGRYNLGVTDIFEDGTPFEGVDAKNNVWQFGIGFMF
ncbi:porin family protein [Olleya marilimosa]|uniref:PorT family protein n=1 Tax=Olleya marilimosa TaxID=272164 RepID=A0ABR8LZJ7_9FLAO|nr:porin family protein [Olleya marilimosa]MBD3863925.1 PorT family protein [Olleya marilimosa]MBD3891116.1 PorT family protein [Olleya marilimosa]|tara:strand:- start:36418 stop:37056 length:639 start_codon:yes stop_codon:yes gene_type:complete